MTPWRICPLLILTCLAGCTVQLAYNHLDRLARWSLSDYIELNPAQRELFDARFDALWRWHRRDELPRYAAFLETLPARLDDGTTQAELRSVIDQFMAWGGSIEARALPAAAELLSTLSDEQVSDLAKALERSNREVAEPETGVPLEAAQANWADGFADRFSRLSGRLDPVQRAYLDGQAARYRPELELWAAYRQRWQADFLALLAERGDAVRLQRGLRQLVDQRERYYGAELTAVEADNEALALEVSVWLVNSLSDRQQQRFSDRLIDVAEDLRELSEAPP